MVPQSEPIATDDREFVRLRGLMVERYVEARGVRDPRVLEAMRKVPRHVFVPQVVRAKAYGEGALPIGAGQTISQPYIVGRMIELLELTGGEKVLEVGTGTGYQACVLSHVAARVFSIERINDLALRAVALVKSLSSTTSASKSLTVRTAGPTRRHSTGSSWQRQLPRFPSRSWHNWPGEGVS